MVIRGRKRDNEKYLLDWRRRQVAEYFAMGWEVNRIATELKVDIRTVYRDQEYISKHSNEILHNYLIETLPNVFYKSLYRLDLVNREAWKVLETVTSPRDKANLLLVIGQITRDIIDLITNNRTVVDMVFEQKDRPVPILFLKRGARLVEGRIVESGEPKPESLPLSVEEEEGEEEDKEQKEIEEEEEENEQQQQQQLHR